MAETPSGFDQWGIVEVMGHKKYAGHITEQTVGGASLVRVDVPAVAVRDKKVPAYSKLIGAGSIYMITPTTQDVAEKAAKQLAIYESDPIPVYIPEERQIPASVLAEVDEDGGGRDGNDDDDDLPL